jgi:hypothetical protein
LHKGLNPLSCTDVNVHAERSPSCSFILRLNGFHRADNFMKKLITIHTS